MKTALIIILYDSITNSVFESQVLAPLVEHEAPHRPVIIVSYERSMPPKHTILKVNLAHRNISLIILRRFGPLDLLLHWLYAQQLIRLLSPYTYYELRARGPFAGNIALRAIAHYRRDARCTKLTIQARGLAAEEFRWTHRTRWSIARKIYYRLLQKLERFVYTKAGTPDAKIKQQLSQPQL